LLVISREAERPALPQQTNLFSSTLELELMHIYLHRFLAPLLLLGAAFVAATIGYYLMRAAGRATRRVIPEQDYELLRDAILADREHAIDNYVRLSSLTGITGTFTQVGLTGLPLATIGLTVLFTVLSLLATPLGSQLFDLAKLTLGAFIGSYVQRSIGGMTPHL
jgi:hypothetical protein